jgi:hypothetical protein
MSRFRFCWAGEEAPNHIVVTTTEALEGALKGKLEMCQKSNGGKAIQMLHVNRCGYQAKF